MTPEQIRRLRVAAGVDETALPDNASTAQIDAALAKLADASPETPPASEPNTEPGAGVDVGNRPADADGGEGNPAETEPQPESQPEGVAAALASLPEGMVVVPRDTLNQLQAGAQAGLSVKAERDKDERDRTISAAVDKGKFAPAQRPHFEKLWAKDPEGTKHLLTASADQGGLPENLVPVVATGTAPQEGDLDGGPGYDTSMLPPAARERIAAAAGGAPTSAGGARIVREV